MSLFKNLGTDDLEQAEDRLGGGYQPLESGIYPVTVKALYAGEAASGAMNLTLLATLEDGREYRETIYITDRNKQNFFINKNSNKKSPLPGFTTVNDICLITTGMELSELETEEKVVKVWDFDAKAEVPKSVPMVTAALGKKVALGIIKQLENKSVKGADGQYVPTEETREINQIDKVFHPELKVTVAEARAGKESTFWDAWEARNKGQTRDKRKIKEGAGNAGGGTPPKAGAAQAPRKSLFSK